MLRHAVHPQEPWPHAAEHLGHPAFPAGRHEKVPSTVLREAEHFLKFSYAGEGFVECSMPACPPHGPLLALAPQPPLL